MHNLGWDKLSTKKACGLNIWQNLAGPVVGKNLRYNIVLQEVCLLATYAPSRLLSNKNKYGPSFPIAHDLWSKLALTKKSCEGNKNEWNCKLIDLTAS